MKNITSIPFISICALLLLLQHILCMENNSFIPCTRLAATEKATVLIKKNFLALMEPNIIEIHDINALSSDNKRTVNKYTSLEAYDSIDINEQATKMGISKTIDNYSSIKIYSLKPINFNTPYFSITENKSIQTLMFSCTTSHHGGIVKFFANDTIMVADHASINIWDTEKNKPTPVPISKPCLSQYQTCAMPIITTVSTKKNRYAYYSEELHSLFINNPKLKYFFLFALAQFPFPNDIKKVIFSTILSFNPLQQIKLDNISDTICSIEYCSDGKHISLTGKNSINIYTINSTSIDDKDNITNLPFPGFSTFHPNNNIIFVLPCDGTALLAIDLKTQKIIYKQKMNNEPMQEPAYGKLNKIIAFNEDGNKLALIFDGHCRVYTIPESLQHFFNSYDPEKVSALTKDPAEKTILKNNFSFKSHKKRPCILQ